MVQEEVIDGVMLGDGHITRSRASTDKSCFVLMLGGTEHIDWLLSVKSSLVSLFPDCIPPKVKVGSGFSNGKLRTYSYLRTLSSDYFGAQRRRWYEGNGNGNKVIPQDLKLTPAVLGNWYMGDGSLCYDCVALCTQGFKREDTVRLKRLLCFYLRVRGKDINIRDCYLKDGSKRGILYLSATATTPFLESVHSLVLSSFDYKMVYAG